jgi:hypothetical protein
MTTVMAPGDRWLAVGQRTATELDTLTNAVHGLERAIIRPAPRRECRWAAAVAVALRGICRAIADHRDSVEADDGLLAAIARSLPCAEYRIARLREMHRALLFEAEGLLRDVDCMSDGDCLGAAAIRRRAVALMDAVRFDQAHEVDLVYEAFELDVWAFD